MRVAEKKILECVAIRKTFNRAKDPILLDISFCIKRGEIVTLVGASGSGKTTLLRIIAGLEFVDDGKLFIGNLKVLEGGKKAFVAPQKRKVGMVFQDFALFPHLTVANNIAFGLKSWGKEEKLSRIDRMLTLFKISELRGRYPHQLSGGQKQRVGVARALAFRPELLLLDEPFGHLDKNLRLELGRELIEVLKDEGISALLVTHDCEEAQALGEKQLFLQNGMLWSEPTLNIDKIKFQGGVCAT